MTNPVSVQMNDEKRRNDDGEKPQHDSKSMQAPLQYGMVESGGVELSEKERYLLMLKRAEDLNWEQIATLFHIEFPDDYADPSLVVPRLQSSYRTLQQQLVILDDTNSDIPYWPRRASNLYHVDPSNLMSTGIDDQKLWYSRGRNARCISLTSLSRYPTASICTQSC